MKYKVENIEKCLWKCYDGSSQIGRMKEAESGCHLCYGYEPLCKSYTIKRYSKITEEYLLNGRL